jgi:hypothetical protein
LARPRSRQRSVLRRRLLLRLVLPFLQQRPSSA